MASTSDGQNNHQPIHRTTEGPSQDWGQSSSNRLRN